MTINKKRSIEELEALVKNLQKEVVQLRKYTKRLEKQLSGSGDDPSKPTELKRPKTPTSMFIQGTRKRSMSVGSAPRPTSPSHTSDSEEAFSDDEDYNPLAYAEAVTQLEEVQK